MQYKNKYLLFSKNTEKFSSKKNFLIILYNISQINKTDIKQSDLRNP